MGAADSGPPLRADARRNRERVLQAAREVFAESGFAAPLDEIAARAGVGAGTVYRHFPTKEALFEAVSAARVADLVADARRRADEHDPATAFFGFLALLGAEVEAKRDTSDAIAVPGPLGEAMQDALALLLTRAQQAGAVRQEVTAADLVAILKGLLTAAHEDTDPGRSARLLAILTAGLRPDAL
ncbi:Transcriptional regulator, TetR family [Frankia canadensis]|uniref:Transcriptional regulator, TetR family n=1 Tax=Frankia canadensis TaxID=1836972 RepID=A0A2I2KP45_9ACTN|nr:TetR/AcrR family transcriptional regulator [Frankia canadensis]SNQ47441.1 Transcriptional regulator, TetR family [Frankia canadensis]SOU54731.1 Transcriptional regulator, TetR family [Frankia canadensis]